MNYKPGDILIESMGKKTQFYRVERIMPTKLQLRCLKIGIVSPGFIAPLDANDGDSFKRKIGDYEKWSGQPIAEVK